MEFDGCIYSHRGWKGQGSSNPTPAQMQDALFLTHPSQMPVQTLIPLCFFSSQVAELGPDSAKNVNVVEGTG